MDHVCVIDIFRISRKKVLQNVSKTGFLTGHFKNQWAELCITFNKNKQTNTPHPKKPLNPNQKTQLWPIFLMHKELSIMILFFY